jgi:2-polyprenyl-3-methyl-5-hydroxy-6-metoxy-1,4-benzoquinol methylase
MNRYDYSLFYGRMHDQTEHHAERVAAQLAGMLGPELPVDRSASILDLGCGFGFALRAVRNLGYTNARGLEASPEQAAVCSRAGFEVEVCQSTTAWLAERPACFDCVLLLDVLEHVPKSEQIDFLRAIQESLRAGGRLIITTPNANSILASRQRYNDYTHLSSFTENSLHFVLLSARFENIRIDAEKGLGRFPRRLWRRAAWPAMRKWIVRWCWMQVFKAELPLDECAAASFELNLKAVAFKP